MVSTLKTHIVNQGTQIIWVTTAMMMLEAIAMERS